MERRRWAVAALIAASIVGATGALWYFESPLWTLRGIKHAAQSHDADALSSYVDYSALRESLKSELTARMAAEAQKEKSGFGALGVAFGSAMIGPMIDGLVSPAAMRAALLAERDNGSASAASALHLPQQPVIIRRGFSEFVVTAKNQPNSGLVFRRHGLSWMLSGVELAAD